jgi:uncharacterized protein YcfJ
MTHTTPRTIPTLLAFAGLALAALPVQAQDLARVISSVAVIQQVAVPRQVCSTQQVMVEQPRSGAGALLGAVAGGAAGNAIGDGSGRAAATAIGIIGGAMLGNRIEGSPGTRMQDQTTCSTQNIYENRTIGYNVTYEYAGRQYQVQLPQDPGPTIRVQVTPMAPAPAAPTRIMQAPTDSVEVYATAPARVQRVAVVGPTTVIHPQIGFYGGFPHGGHFQPHPHPHGHPHRHWR